MSRADIVSLDLFSLGCPIEFNNNSPSWQTNFDLGVTFTQISHVYIDWSGEITGGLAQHYDWQTGELIGPYPLDVGIEAYLGRNPHARLTDVYGGEATYPSPETFDGLNEFTISGTTTWSDMLDGTGNIWIEYTEFGFLFSGGGYVQHGSVNLDSATLVVDGTLIPEPTSILLLVMGVGIFRTRYLNKP
ncbi:MAG: hypothetical protein WCW64_11505 [Phycisphaerae bacterium]